MKNINIKKMAEEATGCKQQGSIIYYNSSGEKITKEQALDLFLKYELIKVPQAGAGNTESRQSKNYSDRLLIII